MTQSGSSFPRLTQHRLFIFLGGKSMNDRQSWAIKDDAILNDLAALMNLSLEEMGSLSGLQNEAQAIAPQLIDAFYRRLLEHAPTAEYLEGMVEHLRGTFQQWFMDLFSGQYDQAYVASRLAIGKAHVRIGLPVRYPLAMMDLVIQYGDQVAIRSDQPALASQAVRKLAALDIAIFNQAYENTQLDHLAALVGNERLARRLLTSE
jgi:hypothetical protein